MVLAAPHTVTLLDPHVLAKRIADELLELSGAKDNTFAICLSGGSTPELLYRLLAGTPYASKMPWDQIHLFWGDERFVPRDDQRSNYRMVHQALLAHVPIPDENIHIIETENIDAHQAALNYEQELKKFYGADTLDPSRPLFDFVLLGLGPDGHTASLFPGTGVLNNRTSWVSEVVGPKAEMRITLTYPVLESTVQSAFLVAGSEKQAILRRYQSGDMDLPATRYNPAGMLTVYADQAAAPGRAPITS